MPAVPLDTLIRVARDTALVHDTTAVRDTIARVVAASDTLLVRIITHPWALGKDVLQVLLPLATFLFGQWAASRKYSRDRHEAENQLGHEISTGVSNIRAQLLATKSGIDAGRGLVTEDLEELKRRLYAFEPVVRRLNILRDQDYATKVYTWYSQAQSTPGALQTLVGPHRDEPQEVPAYLRDMATPGRTKGRAAEGTVAAVLAEGVKLGVMINIVDDGQDLRRRMETGKYHPIVPSVDMTPVTPRPRTKPKPEAPSQGPTPPSG